MDPLKEVLDLTADYAAQFLGTLDERPIRAEALRYLGIGTAQIEPLAVDGRAAMRISVSNWQTSAEDVERSAAAILVAAAAVTGSLR